MMEMSSPAVSHHLRPLRNRGLIVSRRVGKEVYYRAADTEQSRLPVSYTHLDVYKRQIYLWLPQPKIFV